MDIKKLNRNDGVPKTHLCCICESWFIALIWRSLCKHHAVSLQHKVALLKQPVANHLNKMFKPATRVKVDELSKFECIPGFQYGLEVTTVPVGQSVHRGVQTTNQQQPGPSVEGNHKSLSSNESRCSLMPQFDCKFYLWMCTAIDKHSSASLHVLTQLYSGEQVISANLMLPFQSQSKDTKDRQKGR